MYRKIFIVVLSFLIVPTFALAGTTGKIKGKVTDRENDEPLPGANVVVDGTTFGAGTDLNGEFVILNVPSGVYTLKCSFVGYQTTTITNLKISVDLTTDVNFKLASEAIELSAIQIVAERPLVNKNATNAVRIAVQDDIKNLPVRGINQAIALQAGVVQIGDNFHIRGSRADETAFFIEGASAATVVSGGGTQAAPAQARVIPEAMEEFQVQAGGYNAEYGGANAGIVRQTLRSGTSDYHLSLQLETDRHTKQFDNGFLNTYSYGYSNYVGTFSGPVLGDKMKLFLAGENEFFRDPFIRFWDGFTIEDAKDSGNRQGKAGEAVPDGDIVVKDGNIPGAMSNRFTGNGTLTFDLKPLILRLSGTQSWSRFIGTTTPITNLFVLDRLPATDASTGLYNLKATHVVNPKTFYELNVSYYDSRNKRYDQLFEDDLVSYADSLALASKGYSGHRSYSTSPQPYDIYGFSFLRPGTDLVGNTLAGYTKQKQNSINVYGFLTTQWRSHELKVGGGYEYVTFRSFAGLGGNADLLNMRQNPDVVRTPGAARDRFFIRQLNVDNFGYDLYGNEVDNASSLGIDGPKHPKYYNAFIQDKFEANDLVINVGIRLDHFDNDDFVFSNPNDPAFDPTNQKLILSGISKAPTFDEISPRVGLAFPVTDRTVFHLQYGKFVQMPRLNQFYGSTNDYIVSFSGGNFIPNPFGNGIEPERTIQYEIGFSQQISDVFAFDVTTFYKDIRGQLQIVRITAAPGANASAYNALANGDFATTKGLELSLTLRRTNRVQGSVSYTYSSAQGTGSTTNSAVGGIENASQLPTVISPLTFNQTHRGSVNFDYRFGKGDGGPILERLGLNALLTFNSGHPYTLLGGTGGQQDVPMEGDLLNSGDPRFRNPLEPIGSSTTPWVLNLDLRLNKTVSFGKINADFYVYSTNVLNRRNVINVYERTGNAYDDGFFGLSQSANVIAGNGGANYVDTYEKINYANRQHLLNRTAGVDLFAAPRQIRFGVNIQY